MEDDDVGRSDDDDLDNSEGDDGSNDDDVDSDKQATGMLLAPPNMKDLVLLTASSDTQKFPASSVSTSANKRQARWYKT